MKRSVIVGNDHNGPGIVKVRKATVVTRRTVELVAVREGWWSRLLDSADLISEGEPVADSDGRAYYGSTSLRCSIEEGLRAAEVDDAEQLAQLVLNDPHARLRMLRLAHREAVVRAGAPLHMMAAELSARVLDIDGVPTMAIVVDVSADLAEMGSEAVTERQT